MSTANLWLEILNPYVFLDSTSMIWVSVFWGISEYLNTVLYNTYLDLASLANTETRSAVKHSLVFSSINHIGSTDLELECC